MIAAQNVGSIATAHTYKLGYSQASDEVKKFDIYQPNKELLVAIIDRAFLDLRQDPSSPWFRAARTWLEGRDKVTVKFSLRWILSQMDLNPDVMLQGIKDKVKIIIEEEAEIRAKLASGEMTTADLRRHRCKHPRI